MYNTVAVMGEDMYGGYSGKMESIEKIDEGMEYMEQTPISSSTNTILWITIGVCIVIGITLGIILGRRSARK